MVKAVLKDTIPVNDTVRMTRGQEVKCNSCGAEYSIDTYLNKRPTVSKEMLQRIDNIVHP